MNLKLTKLELLRPNFIFDFDKIRIKNLIVVFHFSIDEQLREVGKRIRYLFSMCSQNKMVSSKAAGGGDVHCLLIRGIRDMAVLADVGVDFVQDLLSGRSKTVKHLSDPFLGILKNA